MFFIRCDVWYKVTKMRANHNVFRCLVWFNGLWCMVQSYKNESKSQRVFIRILSLVGCDVWYKVTKMRANHNLSLFIINDFAAVMYGTKLQKWEQITTQMLNVDYNSLAVMYGTKLQKWEQITTAQTAGFFPLKAVMYGTKLQKWEQITTQYHLHPIVNMLWCMVQSYKNESKSQHDQIR